MGNATGLKEYAGAALTALARPAEVLEHWVGRRERLRQEARPQLDFTDVNALEAAHHSLGVSKCGICESEISEITTVLSLPEMPQHIYDSGPSLVQVIWAVVRHLKPRIVLETGVARGVSSAVVLSALEVNGQGDLWSIDLPPMNPRGRVATGSAVPETLKSRWHYVRGASRRRLPVLLDTLGSVEVFIHDGLHTEQNMKFEFGSVWPRLADGGFLISDDAGVNRAFVNFAESQDRQPSLVLEADGVGLVGMLRR